jgi:hypothetical protein
MIAGTLKQILTWSITCNFLNSLEICGVRKYLTPEDWSTSKTKDRPWYGLLALLRKYPEHFVINTRSKGKLTLEVVSLVSLLS